MGFVFLFFFDDIVHYDELPYKLVHLEYHGRYGKQEDPPLLGYGSPDCELDQLHNQQEEVVT